MDWKPTRRRVFCASLADVFDNEVDLQWRVDLFELIGRTPHLDWLLLTKRIGNAEKMIVNTLAALRDRGHRPVAWPWPNVWLGATVCNQQEADRDLPKLMSVPAAVRFASIEPMLGPVMLPRFCGCGCRKPKRDVERAVLDNPTASNRAHANAATRSTLGIDWVIVGGESGHHARPIRWDWVCSMRDQCADANVPFLFKQWGEWLPGREFDDEHRALDPSGYESRFACMDWDGRNFVLASSHWTNGLSDGAVFRIGKKNAGRRLEGHHYTQFPTGQGGK